MEWYEKGVAWDPFGFGGTNNGQTWVDLRLGETSNSIQKQARAVSKSVSSSSSSSSSSKSKRSRAYYKAQENAKCSVDGCEDELKDCRDYHRRHRVCEMHSKTAVVLIKGIQQRFCQQCSRFHSLDEFDDFKRSCRRRLEGHNKRRRKPHPRSLLFSSDYSGPRLLQFGSPTTDIYGKAYLSTWHGLPKAKAEPMSYNNGCYLDQQSLVSAFANIQNLQDRQVPVLQPNGNEAVYEQIHGDGATTGFQNMSPDSALYLLSALQTPTSDFSVVESNMSCPNQLQVQPPLGHIHFDGADKCSSCSRRMNGEASDPTWTLLEAHTPNLHCNGDEGSLTFPFSWE